MKILAIDTTGEFGSIALAEGSELLAETELHSPDGYAHVIFAAIEGLLCRACWTISDIGCFAAASGPGSFTGVRVGLTAAKALAEAKGKPVASVSNLRALATFGTAQRRAVIMDARRGDIYAAVYDADLRPIAEDTVTKLPTWLEGLDNGEYEFITTGGDSLVEQMAATRFAGMPRITAPRALAGAVARCAFLDSQIGALVSALNADANYVRRSDAELSWKDG
jgi:tRNA threonylcarbamoyladenosine biosynthesis protein TsaB